MSVSNPNPRPTNPAFMQAAIQLAIDGVRSGRGGPFGAIVVKDGKTIGRGCNTVTSTNDPTAHAEINAIRDACRTLGAFHLTDCEIYASCEPCPMCLASIYWAHLDRCYYGCTAADAAAIGFSDDFIRRQLTLAPTDRTVPVVQLLPSEALAAFHAWTEKTDKVPY